MTIHRTRAGIAVAAVLATVLVTAGCSGDDEPDATPSATASTATEAPALPTTTTVGVSTGKLAQPQRRQSARQVGAVVDGWLDAAFVAGDYPRSDFSDAFPGFSRGAAQDARGDLRLMSNAALGPRIDGVEAVKRRVQVDLLSARGRAVGATARVLLVYDTQGDVERRERVQGRLFLTKKAGTWQVFGYDVTKGSAR